LSKLYEKHPVFGVSYFKRKFSGNERVMEELSNMERYKDDNLEYYSSFEYLKYLLTNFDNK